MRSPASPELPAYLPALDGVRGIAILLVLVHQLGMLEVVNGFASYLFRYTIGFGWTGVQLFFVLSGFLITGILLDTQKCTNYFSGFYARRCLRIFPLYYGALLLAFVAVPLAGLVPDGNSRYFDHQIWYWLYLSNWAAPLGADNHLFPHFWSLAVEEQFYLLWPLLLMRASAGKAFYICLGVAGVGALVRTWMVSQGASEQPAFSEAAIYSFTVCRMDALALGGALAAAMRVPGWWEKLLAAGPRLALGALVLAVAGAAFSHGFSVHTAEGELWGYTLVAIVFSMLIASVVADDARPSSRLVAWLRSPPLRSLGKYSYAMYVFHKPLHDFVGRPLIAKLGWPMGNSILYNAAYVALGTAALWLLAILSYHVFEKHFLKLKAKFAPRPAAG